MHVFFFSPSFIPPSVTTQSFFTLSCFIFAWTSHSEKCSILVSCRSISVSHTRMLSRAVSNSSRWPIKCWRVENWVAWNDQQHENPQQLWGNDFHPHQTQFKLSIPSFISYVLSKVPFSITPSRAAISRPMKVIFCEEGGVWCHQAFAYSLYFGSFGLSELICFLPLPKVEISSKTLCKCIKLKAAEAPLIHN